MLLFCAITMNLMKSGMYMTTSDIQLCGWPIKLLKVFRQGQHAQKKSWSLMGAPRPA